MTTAEILLLAVVLMLGLLLLLVFVFGISIKSSLNRIEHGKSPVAGSSAKAAPATAGESPQDEVSPFDEFIAEDPARLGLSKSEQAAAYREWRRAKGMNWSNS